MSASPEGDVSPKLERSSPAQAPISPHQRAMAALEQRVNVGSRSILLAVRLTLTQYDYTMQSITSKRGVLRGDTRRPAEVDAPPVDLEEYRSYRQATDLREPYRIPHDFLQHIKKVQIPDVAEAPLIVFINSRSGGRAGPKLTDVLYHALGHSQVFDLQEFRPGQVLQQIYKNFEDAERRGDPLAASFKRRLRILAAGGDGTVAWLLGTIRELKLDPPPSVAVMPLGTGNDLSLSFGWGNTFLHKWIKDYTTIYSTMKRIADAEPRDLDAWTLSMTLGDKSLFGDLPHSLSLIDNGMKTSSGEGKVEGLFWNYFSIGMDATAAYGFHHLRETKPWAAPSRMINQAWYAYYGCASGWFCCAKPIKNTVSLKVRSTGGEWRTVEVPSSVKAIVVLNLQSYAGGRDLWGLKDTAKDAQKGWRTPIFNDGTIEALGLRSGWHTAAVMGGVSTKVHAVRLAQGNNLQLEVRGGRGGTTKGDSPVTHMQLDGEPWPQDLPADAKDPPLRINISLAGTSKMLFNTEKLSGMPRKIKELAKREAQVSLHQQTSMKEQRQEVQMAGRGNPDVQVASNGITQEVREERDEAAWAAAQPPQDMPSSPEQRQAHAISNTGVQGVAPLQGRLPDGHSLA